MSQDRASQEDQHTPAADADSTPAEAEVAHGLPMFSARDKEVIEQEKAHLRELAGKGFLERCRGYFSMTGPGWLQSAMTLGGGSAFASLYAGAYLGYDLLWLQPFAMILGIIMLYAMAHQTVCTGARPFDATKKYVHPGFAWAWAIATLVSTLIWHFPQYALAAGMTEDMIKATTKWEPTGGAQTGLLLGIGVVYLIISTAITWNYGSGARGVKLYERMLKFFVWMILIAFAAVVIARAGDIEWGKVLKGYLPIRIPTDDKGVSIVMAAFGAAVGINMTFLFPYTILARGWGKEHKGLAKYDLITGMFIPYALATSLVMIATASTLYDPAKGMISPVEAASMFEKAGLGAFVSRFIFGLGILGMVLSSITTHMLVSGFAICEMFGLEPSGWRYRLACLFPVPGMFGVILWKSMKTWIAVPTSAICGLMLPIAYIIFFILNNRKDYLGDYTPRGGKAVAWNIAMVIAIVAAIGSGVYYIIAHI